MKIKIYNNKQRYITTMIVYTIMCSWMFVLSQGPITMVLNNDRIHDVPKNIRFVDESHYIKYSTENKPPDTIIVIKNDSIPLFLSEKIRLNYGPENSVTSIRILPSGEVFDSTRFKYSQSNKILLNHMFEKHGQVIYEYKYDKSDRLNYIANKFQSNGNDSIELVGELNCDYFEKTNIISSISSTLGFSKKYSSRINKDSTFYLLDLKSFAAFSRKEFGMSMKPPREKIYLLKDSVGLRIFAKTIEPGDFRHSFNSEYSYDDKNSIVFKKESTNKGSNTHESYHYDKNGRLELIHHLDSGDKTKYYYQYDKNGSVILKYNSTSRGDFVFRKITYK